MIPKNIFQTHKSIDYIQSNLTLSNACNSWKNNKDFNYYFYDDNQCNEFITKFFPELTNISKNNLHPFRMILI